MLFRGAKWILCSVVVAFGASACGPEMESQEAATEPTVGSTKQRLDDDCLACGGGDVDGDLQQVNAPTPNVIGLSGDDLGGYSCGQVFLNSSGVAIADAESGRGFQNDCVRSARLYNLKAGSTIIFCDTRNNNSDDYTTVTVKKSFASWQLNRLEYHYPGWTYEDEYVRAVWHPERTDLSDGYLYYPGLAGHVSLVKVYAPGIAPGVGWTCATYK
jgi:hypothetical protein